MTSPGPLFDYREQTKRLYKRAGTSSRAAHGASRKSPGHAIQALRWLAENPAGNADHVATRIGIPFISIRPRFTQMADDGWIERTGEEGLSAFQKPQDIYAITDLGRAILKAESAG